MGSRDEFDLILYDGRCGLCHRQVRRLLDAGAAGQRFRFAPLQGQTAWALLAERGQSAMPDSVVVLTADGRMLVRGDAVIYVLEQLGGRRRRWAKVLRRVPRPMRDLGYRLVAALRRQVRGRPAALCPPVPPAQRERFLP